MFATCVRCVVYINFFPYYTHSVSQRPSTLSFFCHWAKSFLWFRSCSCGAVFFLPPFNLKLSPFHLFARRADQTAKPVRPPFDSTANARERVLSLGNSRGLMQLIRFLVNFPLCAAISPHTPTHTHSLVSSSWRRSQNNVFQRLNTRCYTARANLQQFQCALVWEWLYT